jgi:NADH:ubiquinone oxidoreductase subunit 6 (subunit J)
MQHVIFIMLSLLTLGAALLVVTSRSLFRSALWLILAFAGIAALFILLHAEFLAIVQVLIYIGAISTLIIFAIMLSRSVMNPNEPRFNDQWRLVIGFAALLFVALAAVVTQVPWPVNVVAVAPDAIQQLGTDFVGAYVIPFEVASILLVAALIGAIIVARERE